ncbi:uncharacterized protein LOC135109478 [Scylla paramamosain]|uniref:uncharacterized protein LOC135109478 n=1 Tax=Scylla paramamosain TaxID=85552 RepID=UPI003082C00C
MAFQVPRCYKREEMGDVILYQLHRFSDASQKACGAVSYLRMIGAKRGKPLFYNVWQSKASSLETAHRRSSRGKLHRQLKNKLDTPLEKSIFWTDSVIVLQYIRNSEKWFCIFVVNCIMLIKERTMSEQWRYVNSSLNPADNASRSLSAAEISADCRWTQGPLFLWKGEHEWLSQSKDGRNWHHDPEFLNDNHPTELCMRTPP